MRLPILREPRPTCQTCFFWTTNSWEDRPLYGECRRGAPGQSTSTRYTSWDHSDHSREYVAHVGWVRVERGDWCGEYYPRDSWRLKVSRIWQRFIHFFRRKKP